MCKAPYVAALLGLTLSILASDKTAAQQFDASGIVYEAARNKIGLMRHCRNNTTLDTAIAEKAVKVIEAELRAFPLENDFAQELGDLAEEAGEDGFLDTARGRDITSFAQLFRTTRASLCQEWAAETLRTRGPSTSSYVSIATGEPTRAAGTIAPPSLNVAHTIAIPRAAVLPPFPAKAPLRPTRQRAAAMAARLGNGRSFAPQTLPTAARLGGRAAEPLPRQRAAAPIKTNRWASQSDTMLEKWPFNLFKKPYSLREKPWRN
jgi:hypothetical protein